MVVIEDLLYYLFVHLFHLVIGLMLNPSDTAVLVGRAPLMLNASASTLGVYLVLMFLSL